MRSLKSRWKASALGYSELSSLRFIVLRSMGRLTILG
jgi:hypothetical protein